MKTRVYIAGPISKGDLRHNIQQARNAAMALMHAGFAPLCPHMTCFLGGDSPEVLPCGTSAEDWYGIDLPWVAVADAVLRLSGESVGADLEVEEARKREIPVYTDFDQLVAATPLQHTTRCNVMGQSSPEVIAAICRLLDVWNTEAHPTSAAFYELLIQAAELHSQKQKDYGTKGDPFANVRASEGIGIPAWKGAWLRARDKVKRIDNYCLTGTLANEGVCDSWMDLACYSLICLVLFREQNGPAEVKE